MNYNITAITGNTKFYYLNDPYIHGLNLHLHRLDGPAIAFLEKNSGTYYIDNVFIGCYPKDKELYEKAVEKYIKQKIFE